MAISADQLEAVYAIFGNQAAEFIACWATLSEHKDYLAKLDERVTKLEGGK